VIPADRAGTAVATDASGGWCRIRTPQISRDEVAAVCRDFSHLVPDLPFLEPFRPSVPAPSVDAPSLVK
jgi:S-DNA-T family DNA segregation ATPase FtsK/SpoIIIE